MLIYILISCYITYTLAVPHNLNKRQVVAPLVCGNQPNTVAICSPSETSVWYNNTIQEFTWKYNNPKFDQYSLVDLYLLKMNESGDYNVQKTWPGLPTSVGASVQLVDDSWFPSPIADDSPNVTWTMYAYVAGANFTIEPDLAKINSSHNYFPAPQLFTLIQNAHNTTNATDGSSTSSAAATSAPTALAGTSASASSSSSNHFPNWAIAVICIAVVLVIAAAAGLIWVRRRHKNKKAAQQKILIENSNNNTSNEVHGHPDVLVAPSANNTKADISSIHSSTPMINHPSTPSGEEMSSIITDRSALGINNRINQSSGVLSSTDALLIADTFRHLMRKPEWNEEDDDDDRSLKKEGTHSESLETQ